MKLIGARGRGKGRLRGSSGCRRVGVGGNQSHLPDLAHQQLVGSVIERVVANVVVLDVDPVQRHVRVGRPQPVDHGVRIAVRHHAGLGLENRQHIAVEDRQVAQFLRADGAGDLRAGGVHALDFGRDVDRLGEGGQLQPDRGHIRFARGIHGDAADGRLHEAFGVNREVVIGGAHANEVVEPLGGSFDGQKRLLAAG